MKKSIEIHSAKQSMFENWMCYLFFNRTSIEIPRSMITLDNPKNDTRVMNLEFFRSRGHGTSTNVFWRTYNHKRIWMVTWTGVCSFIHIRRWKMRWNDRIWCLVFLNYEFALSRDVPPFVKGSNLCFEYPHKHLLSYDILVHENVNDGFVYEEKSVFTHFNCLKGGQPSFMPTRNRKSTRLVIALRSGVKFAHHTSWYQVECGTQRPRSMLDPRKAHE